MNMQAQERLSVKYNAEKAAFQASMSEFAQTPGRHIALRSQTGKVLEGVYNKNSQSSNSF
jgi:hypothetical protein